MLPSPRTQYIHPVSTDPDHKMVVGRVMLLFALHCRILLAKVWFPYYWQQ